MAPETILGDADVDRRADVYALGCVAYYLLTGQLVFEADTSMKMLMHHLNTPPVPPSQRTELPIPRELDELVLACLQKDPDRGGPRTPAELFRMAYNCRACEGWDADAAAAWWKVHLPELTGPLTVRRAERQDSRGGHVMTDAHAPDRQNRRSIALLGLAADVRGGEGDDGRPAGAERLSAAGGLLRDSPGAVGTAAARSNSMLPGGTVLKGEEITSYLGAVLAALFLVIVPLYGALAGASDAHPSDQLGDDLLHRRR